MQKYIIIALSILVMVLSVGAGILYNDYSYLNELHKNNYKLGGFVERCQACFREVNTKEDEKKINEEGIENSKLVLIIQLNIMLQLL